MAGRRAVSSQRSSQPPHRRRRDSLVQSGRGDDLPRDGAPDAHKNAVKPWLVEQWCLAPTADPECVWHMEDVLDVYHRPFDPLRPVVCLDETSRQLFGEVRPPLPAAPGRPVRHDPEYERGGVANLFVLTEPLRGWRAVTVSQQRTPLDFAACVKELVDTHYPHAERIVLVLDQLNTHSPASLYAAFPPAEAKRLADKLEIHDTPKHGSWLNMAELELSALHRQCLRRQLDQRIAMARAAQAWASRRHDQTKRIDWHFTTDLVRITLRRLYPAFECWRTTRMESNELQ